MLGLRIHRNVLLAQEQADGAPARSGDGMVDGENQTVESLGHRLRARREAMQLDVQAVCEKLHVRCAVIEALEADDHERAGTPLVYLRGYARNYVRLLNPEESLLQVWLDEIAQIGIAPLASVKRRGAGLRRVSAASIRPWFNPRWLLWVAIMLVVLLAVFLLQPSSRLSSPALPIVAPDTTDPIAAASVEVVAETATVSSPTVPAASTTNAGVVDAPTEKTDESVMSSQAPSPRGTLRLEFTDRSWTQIEDGLGRVLEKRTVEAGSTNRYEGVLPFQVTLGNAVYVRVYFNDQEYDHLNDITDKNIARFQLGAREVQ